MHFRNFCILALFLVSLPSTTAQSNTDSLLEVTEQDFVQMSELMRHLRSGRREDLFIPVAKLQLAHITHEISRVAPSDPDRANELRQFARGICFNIASFSWPGWGDEPKPIPIETQKLGLAAARQGVTLAKAAKDLTSNILWIQGAHELNAGLHENAADSFSQSKQLAKNDFLKEVQKAWLLMAQAAGSLHPNSHLDFNAQLELIRKADHEYSQFHTEQLETASGIYLTATQ